MRRTLKRRQRYQRKPIGNWHRYSCEVKTVTEDAADQPVHTWTHSFYLQGSMNQVRGEERLRAEATRVSISHRFYCRYDSRLVDSEEKRLRCTYNDKIYNIKQADNINEESKEMTLYIEEDRS